MDSCWSRFKNIDADDLLSYETIKLVKIRDRRLGIMHFFLQFGIFIYIVVYTIIIQQRYLRQDAPYGSIRPTAQEPAPWADASTLPYCKQNQSSLNGFDNFDCVYMLGLDITYPAALMDSILVATRMKDTFYPVPNNTNCPPPSQPATTFECAPYKNESTSTRYYIDDIENYTVYIEHAIYGRANRIAATNKDFTGVLYYNDGSGRSIVLNDPTRSGDIFPIQTLLEAADVPSLDVLSALGDGDSLRYDGVLILMVVEYSNGVLHPNQLSYTYTLFTVPGVNVISQEPSQPVSGGISQRSWYGVRLIFLITGTFGEFDFPTLLTSLVSGLVLVKVATTIVDMIIIYVLPDKIMYREHKYEVTEDFRNIRKTRERTNTLTELQPNAQEMGASFELPANGERF